MYSFPLFLDELSVFTVDTYRDISAYFVINRFHSDIRAFKMYQLLLHSENVALEARVEERTEELERARNHAEKERQRVEMLLQDASHRISNSLGTVASLLRLQLNRSKNEEVRAVLGARTGPHPDDIHCTSAFAFE